MPGTVISELEMSRKCARCSSADADLIVRTEWLCKACFLKYVTTKVLKRMDANKVRSAYGDAPKKLLLPLSLGVSSITLLHVLDQHLRAQFERNKRTSYSLHVLLIDQSAFVSQPGSGPTIEILKDRFPLHTFSVALLDQILEYNVPYLQEVFETHGSIDKYSPLSRKEKLKALLSALPSATSRLDMVNVLRGRLIVAFAETHDCYGVLLGDSTTRLAERTLSETAKGRGASMPWLTVDSTSLVGLKISYPMRDLLKRELGLYVTMTEPPLEPLVVAQEHLQNTPVSSKDTTIDSLMSEYFASVEENYPSIVANVVRTSGRLIAPALLDDSIRCGICGLQVESSPEAWAGLQGDLSAHSTMDHGTPPGKTSLCYGCTRSVAAK